MDPSEECDDAADNGTDNCCSSTCALIDIDSDGTCDRDDNCPSDANPDQEDLDGDLTGDVCDDTDAVLTIRRARVRRADPLGSIVVKGELPLNGPDDAFNALDGVMVQVLDVLDLDQSFLFEGADCTQLSSGFVTCKSPDRAWKAVFVPRGRPPTRYRFSVRFKKLTIVGPFEPPLTTRITSDPAVALTGSDRVGTIAICKITTSGIRCKEP